MSSWVVRHPLVATAVPLALFVLASRWFVVPRMHPGDKLDDYGAVGSFEFVDKDGRAVRDADLSGKVWIAACFFTCCTESCPQLSGALARLQSELANEPDVRLVSLTVDPANDTPKKLDQYATTYQANAERWIFLTGGEEAVHRFVQKQLLLGVAPNTGPDATPGNKMLHSNKLTLIDRRGVIRGYFDGTDPAEVAKLTQAAEGLAGAAMTALEFFPAWNASLNGICTILLIAAWKAILVRRVTLHKRLILSAFGVSVVFLSSYLYYHFAVRDPELSKFKGTGPIRTVYFAVLISHTILAAGVAVMVPITLWLGLSAPGNRHKAIARWVMPIWLYVSITGVAVYWMLYRM